MYYNEAYEERKSQEEALLKKWDKALNADGGIQDEHMARTTAICLENYLEHLHGDPRLIAEDRVQSNAFTGVNLALLGLIARVIPNLIGSELVGIQAMPTPKSPIFTIKWEKDHNKGRSADGEELWTTPVTGDVGLDPHYTSQVVEAEDEDYQPGSADLDIDLKWANETNNLAGSRPFLFENSMYMTAYDVDGNVLADYQCVADYSASVAFALISGTDCFDNLAAGAALTYTVTAGVRSVVLAGGGIAAWPTVDDPGAGTPVDIEKFVLRYEYKGEGEPNVPEISLSISDETVELIRRQLRGKYTMDAAYDLKKLHGINLDSELANMMKVELQAEINREIVGDLRMLAGITKTLDYADFLGTATGVSTTGNYDDAHRVLLDAINILSAEIHVQGRLGRGNWVLGNPTTLAFLDRVPGFVGSGVSYNGKEISYIGSLGGKMKFYSDPMYPKNEFLMGYKGSSSLDCGYISCPYLPITATPTMIHPETGDPSKMFYTRYGKTFNVKGGSVQSNLILNGKYQYSRMFLKNLPAPLSI